MSHDNHPKLCAAGAAGFAFPLAEGRTCRSGGWHLLALAPSGHAVPCSACGGEGGWGQGLGSLHDGPLQTGLTSSLGLGRAGAAGKGCGLWDCNAQKEGGGGGLCAVCMCVQGAMGHEATDTGFAYAPVSQAHGHHHSVQCFALLHCSADQFCTTPGGVCGGGGGGSVSGCLPLAAPIGLSPLLILTLCGSERVFVVSTEPPDDLSCLTTLGGGGTAPHRAAWRHDYVSCPTSVARPRHPSLLGPTQGWGRGVMLLLPLPGAPQGFGGERPVSTAVALSRAYLRVADNDGCIASYMAPVARSSSRW